MTDDLDAIAADLYTQPLAGFTSARNERAAREDDRDLAGRIRALRKPSVAAWVVNVFARERAAQLGEALRLAAELREAQDDLDAAALTLLGRQRRMLTRRLADDAATLAAERGERITASTRESVLQTISTAFFDQDAAAAVMSGRLVRALEPGSESGSGVAALIAGGAPRTPVLVDASVDEVKAHRDRRRAERAVHDAEAERTRAEREHAAAERDAADAARHAASLADRVQALEAELASTRLSERTAATAAESAQSRVVALADEVTRTRAAESVATQELLALRGSPPTPPR